MSGALVRDIPLERYRQEVAPLCLTAVAVAPGGPPVDVVAFDRALLAVPQFFPITLDRHAFRDRFAIPGFYLDAIYDALFGEEIAASLTPRIEALRAAPPANRPTFVLGGSDNHFHWLLDFLPRLALLGHDPAWRRALIVTDRVDAGRQAAIDLVRDAYDLPPLELRSLAPGLSGLRAALVPTALAHAVSIAVWRRVAAHHCPSAAARRRLFLRRGTVARRRLSNEEAVAARLAAAGFETVDPGALALESQMRLFAEAAIVVGTHGAALANVAFMPAGGTLVEIVADQAPSPFPALARAAGLTYGRVAVEVPPGTPAERLNADLAAPLAAIDTLVKRLAG
ncbi:MAG: DUF563 domain-containing protein [Alphaproteobacteria bacterium]